jgi:hypothetical protein
VLRTTESGAHTTHQIERRVAAGHKPVGMSISVVARISVQGPSQGPPPWRCLRRLNCSLFERKSRLPGRVKKVVYMGDNGNIVDVTVVT